MPENQLTVRPLSELEAGENGVITKVLGHGSFRKRITDMGFIRGKNVSVIKRAPLQDPVEYEIMGYRVSLRISEADLVMVASGESEYQPSANGYSGTISDIGDSYRKTRDGNEIEIALVGNPNSGKTTLFNYASRSHERVGNYSGVTVESKEASLTHKGYSIKLTDLPGTYSITEYTPEELFVRKHLTEKMPDIVINVIDSSNLERNLFLTTQLIDMNIRVVIALNMFDELTAKGIRLNYDLLGKMLGIPVIPTVAVRGSGLTDIFDKVIELFEEREPVARHIHINYGNTIEDSIASLQTEIKRNRQITDRYSSRYLAIKLLENDKTTLAILKNCSNYPEIFKLVNEEIARLEKEFQEKSETVIADAKYGFITGALKDTCETCQAEKKSDKKDLDSILTHKIWGFPIFMFIMWLMFQATFTLGSIPMDWIESGVAWLGELVKSSIPDNAFRDLLSDGIIGGVGGVIVFLPNIIILFFFISLMEDTGYMARVSFIMDKLMHLIGLHGKSFIPLLMGFGCNVPAIMATRTLENRKDRMMTMLIIPFMSCSARLPVYVLIISAFFVKYQGLVLLSVYLIGIVIAIILAIVLKNTIFKKMDVPFVMELPPYRIPTIRNTSRHMWFKASQYLRKMGTVILFAALVIWFLGYFPRNVSYSMDYDGYIDSISSSTYRSDSIKSAEITKLQLEKATEHQENSYIGRLGHFIEPAIRPLGFDWKIGISILTGLAAKEVVIGTMGVLYQADNANGISQSSLQDKLKEQVHTSGKMKGKKVFTPLVAYTFMLFILIYFPCVAVIAAIKKESDLKWAVFTIIYTTGIAWLVAFGVYQIGSLFI
jgi:ferrous iron transport protein B